MTGYHRHDLPHAYHDRRTRHEAALEAQARSRAKLKATLGEWLLVATELVGTVLVMCSLAVLIITGGPELAAWVRGLLP